MTKIREMILHEVTYSSTGIKAKVIADSLDINLKTVSSILSQLKKDGKVINDEVLIPES